MAIIQETLDRINRIYQQGINSKIDQDLLLDYTRRFYEHISAISFETAEHSNADKASIAKQQKVKNDIDEQSVTEMTVNTDMENTVPEETTEEPVKVIPAGENNAEADIKIPFTDDLPGHGETPEEAPISDEERLEESLMLQSRNISFEPPHPAEETPLFLSGGIEEDQAEENVLPPQDIPVEEPASQQKDEGPALADYAKIFNFPTAIPTATTADIRKNIGINDKYLFLNELFNSDKSAYEKALDHINKTAQYADAVDWVKDHPAITYKWHDDDDTVLDFYEVLRKHFNDK
ncbi:MAG TPA: hypothetical protein VFL76_08100 [Edaphocola sp.]|nr:hypothetical protein [Edaphocola sp.]